jgi:chromate reductase, NAD(P)H dehydrogenase (quinone)
MENLMWKWMIVLGLLFSTHLSAEVKVLAFSGSSREDSFNKKLVAEASELARQLGAKVTLIDLKDYPLPFYDGDLEAKEGMPAKAKQLRQLMLDNSVIFIASPEYNGSISAKLKNVIDWASRTEEKGGSREAFQGKKFVLMSASPGPGGGARGLEHLRTIIENVGGKVLAQQIVVPDAYNAFDEQGHLKNQKLKSTLQQLVQKALSD